MQDNQYKVNQTQLQLSSGKRILQPSDDPIGSSVVLNLQQQIDVANKYVDNGNSAESELQVEETSMQSVTNILQRIRDLTLQGANGSMGAQDRQAMVVEIKQRLNELVGVANTQLSGGSYLFSGFKSNVKPFTVNGTGSIVYNGDQGVKNVNVNSTVQVAGTDNGDKVFMNIPTGNGAFSTAAGANNQGTGVIGNAVLEDPTAYVGDTYTVNFSQDASGNLVYQITGANSGPVYSAPLPQFAANNKISFNGISFSISGVPAPGDSFTVQPSYSQDMFTSVNQIINALSMSTSTDALQTQFQNAINAGLQNLDQALNHVGEVSASLGSRLNVISSERDINSSFVLESKSTLSTVQDLDYASAATELSKRTLALQAAQQSFVKVQDLTLFKFI